MQKKAVKEKQRNNKDIRNIVNKKYNGRCKANYINKIKCEWIK